MLESSSKRSQVSDALEGFSPRSQETDRHLTRPPFRWTKRDQHTLPVTLEGALPAWLRGDLVRTAPAVLELGSWRANHWFDGLGLLYAFSFGEGVVFKQRLLESEALRDAQRPRQQMASFDTPTQRPLWHRLIKPTPQITDNANVNIVPWEGAWLAMTESPAQHLVDPESLASRGTYRYDDRLGGAILSAHPQFDFERNALVNVATSFGPKNLLRVYSQTVNSRVRKVEGELTFKRVPYLHSFGLTPRHALIIEHPYTVNPLKLLFSNRPFVDGFTWQPKLGTKIWKLDRATGRWTVFHTEALFCFHVANAYDEGGDVVFDFVAYDDASIVRRLERAPLDAGGLPRLAPRFVRARLSQGKSSVALEGLAEAGFEFPSLSYRSDNGRPYQNVWGARFAEDSASTSAIVRIEPGAGERARFSEPGWLYGEPVFVPRPGATRSDDGVVLSVGCHHEQERTSLAVLHGSTLEPLARARVDLSLPLGFHGNFAAS
jgi:carotenoid cleavage dioxygenase-like enzyme